MPVPAPVIRATSPARRSIAPRAPALFWWVEPPMSDIATIQDAADSRCGGQHVLLLLQCKWLLGFVGKSLEVLSRQQGVHNARHARRVRGNEPNHDSRQASHRFYRL